MNIETLAERLEARVFYWFGAALQPALLSKRAVRAIESGRLVFAECTVAPNVIRIGLSPQDYARFAGFRARVEDDVKASVSRALADRGWTVLREPEVSIRPRDGLAPHDISVWCEVTERSATNPADVTVHSVPTHAAEGTTPSPTSGKTLPFRDGQTIALSLDQLRHETLGGPRASLAIPAEHRVIAIDCSLVSIGRDKTNDVVLNHRSVSSHHAEVHRTAQGAFLIRDLNSTNGTHVNRRRIAQVMLRNGDAIQIGACEVLYSAAD